jgi:hypothetical protein
LVVVVETDEVFNGVVWEELAQFGAQLRCQRLVVADDKRRSVPLGDDIGDGEGFARTCHANQRLKAIPPPQPFHKLLNGFRLVTFGLKVSDKLEARHSRSPSTKFSGALPAETIGLECGTRPFSEFVPTF